MLANLSTLLSTLLQHPEVKYYLYDSNILLFTEKYDFLFSFFLYIFFQVSMKANQMPSILESHH